jgi:small-conductance mechanosensitive channel
MSPPLRRELLKTAIPVALLAIAGSLWDALPLTGLADRLFYGALGLVALVLVVRLINALLERLLSSSLSRLDEGGSFAGVKVLMPMLRSLVWLLGALVYLQNQGLELSAVVGALAGAGIGIGFALQGPARDFFTYLTILLDRPFRLGELLRFDDVAGRVLQVGLRSTHLRSLDGELIVVANSDLLAKTIRNYGDQQERRVLQTLLLRHDSPTQATRQVEGLARTAVERSPAARFERCGLVELSPAGLLFELCYFLPAADLSLAQASQQQINLELLESLAQAGLRLAEPTLVNRPGTNANPRG